MFQRPQIISLRFIARAFASGLEIYDNLNSTLKCNSKTGCERSGAAVGSALFSPSKMRSTNETLQPAHAGPKIHN